VRALIDDAMIRLHEGFDKPDALSRNLPDYRSRRIDETGRMISSVTATSIAFIMCKYRYGNTRDGRDWGGGRGTHALRLVMPVRKYAARRSRTIPISVFAYPTHASRVIAKYRGDRV
jgi:hypothetical protein